MKLDMITNRENLIYLSREVERVAVLRVRIYCDGEWSPEIQATTLAMAIALERAHMTAGFGDDAEIAEAIRQLQEFKTPERAND
jgi:hypothetical protein